MLSNSHTQSTSLDIISGMEAESRPYDYQVVEAGLTDPELMTDSLLQERIEMALSICARLINPYTAPSNFLPALDLFAQIENHDPNTAKHSFETAGSLTVTNTLLGRNHDLTINDFWAGLLHDAGKLAVDSWYLNQPDLSTDDRRYVQMEHIRRAQELIGPVAHRIYPFHPQTQARLIYLVSSHQDAIEAYMGKYGSTVEAYPRHRQYPIETERRKYIPDSDILLSSRLLAIIDKVARVNGFQGQVRDFQQALDMVKETLAVKEIEPYTRYTKPVLTAIAYSIINLPRIYG